MHITAEQGRNILMKIIDDLPEEREVVRGRTPNS
jgi:hypothetical protein